jgi:hypothetical protein
MSLDHPVRNDEMETAMEPAKYAKDTKTESLPQIARLTQRVNHVKLPTP